MIKLAVTGVCGRMGRNTGLKTFCTWGIWAQTINMPQMIHKPAMVEISGKQS